MVTTPISGQFSIQFAEFLTSAVDTVLALAYVVDEDDEAWSAEELEIADETQAQIRGVVAHHAREFFQSEYATLMRATTMGESFDTLGYCWMVAVGGYGDDMFAMRLPGPVGESLSAAADQIANLIEFYAERGESGDLELRVDLGNLNAATLHDRPFAL